MTDRLPTRKEVDVRVGIRHRLLYQLMRTGDIHRGPPSLDVLTEQARMFGFPPPTCWTLRKLTRNGWSATYSFGYETGGVQGRSERPPRRVRQYSVRSAA